MRRIGVLVPAAANDPVWQARIGAFQQALALSGWIIGRNVQIDIRWATTDAAAIRREAEELAALAPDIILAAGHSECSAFAAGDPYRADRVHAGPSMRLLPASSIALRGRAATPLGSRPGIQHGRESGWNCSSRLHQGSRAWRFFAMPANALRSASWAPSNPWRRRSGWR